MSSPKTEFGWLARDFSLAIRRHDCGAARTVASKALLRAKTPKERDAVYKMQGKALRCTTQLGRARRRRTP